MSWTSSPCDYFGVQCTDSRQDVREVTKIILPENRLHGSLPSQLGSLQQITELNLTKNELYGYLPSELGLLTTSIVHIDLQNNRFCGEVPEEVVKLIEDTGQTGGLYPGNSFGTPCTTAPTLAPSPAPSPGPSWVPSTAPSMRPSQVPTLQPSSSPTPEVKMLSPPCTKPGAVRYYLFSHFPSAMFPAFCLRVSSLTPPAK